MRVAVLAGGWTGFNDAAWRALADRGLEVLVVREGHGENTDYRGHSVGAWAREHVWEDLPSGEQVAAIVDDFRPDVIKMVSWHMAPYRQVMRSQPAGTLRVLSMDNVWRNTPKQWAGRVAARHWVHSVADCVMVPGDRTERFATMLGFDPSDVIRGSLSADTTLFDSLPRSGDDLAAQGRFLACLRLVHHKGADVLAEAYRRYRRHHEAPWSLAVAGIGPMAAAFDGIDGVDLLGFCQPEQVAAEMQRSSCLVVPSRIDPYGVVVHEGARSGLPIISTHLVGAAPLFVQDGVNGWITRAGSVDLLADAMHRAATAPGERLGRMSDVSRAVGSRLTTQTWAENIHEQFAWRLAALRA